LLSFGYSGKNPADFSATNHSPNVTKHLRLTTEHIKENYLILIIKLLIICLFIYTLISGISNIIDHYNYFANYNANKFTEYVYIVINNYFLRPSLILLIPVIGIFINKKFGWVLIQSYFYFLISNLVFPAKYADLTDKTFLAAYVIGFSLLLLIIILMNKKKISNLTYGIVKTELIKMNIIASIIGISITIILAMIKGNGI